MMQAGHWQNRAARRALVRPQTEIREQATKRTRWELGMALEPNRLWPRSAAFERGTTSVGGRLSAGVHG